MLNRQYFAAPTFADDEDLTRTAQILSTLLNYLTGVLVLAAVVGLPFVYRAKLRSAFILLALLLVILAARTLMHRRRVRLASGLLVGILWFVFATVAILSGGLQSTNIVLMVALTVAAGLLLGLWGALVTAAATSAVCLALVVIDAHGYAPIQPFPAPPASRWMQLTVALVLTVAPLHLALRSLSMSLRSARWQLKQRQRSQEALRREKAFSEALLDRLPGIFVMFTEDGRLVRYNAQHVEITGYDRETLSRMRGADFFAADAWSRITAQPSDAPGGGAFELEVELVGAEGRTIPLYVTGWRRALDDRQYLILIGIDLRERQRAAEEKRELEQMLAQAQKMESIGRLAGGIAHDFNNLLTGICGNAELALMNPRVAREEGESLEQILRASDSAARLIGQLLTFSRKQVTEPQRIDVHQELQGMQQMLSRLIGENVELRWETAAALSAVFMDPVQVEQIVVNLVINGRDAMPQGGELRVRTDNLVLGEATRWGAEQVPAGTYLLLEVEDTGEGIAPEDLPRVFDPFFTTKGMHEGTGLGLATVFGIVTQNGGAVDVSSTVDQGTRFRILLPCLERDAHGVADAGPSTPKDPAAPM
jgi:PAS domain S-box-containing protein